MSGRGGPPVEAVAEGGRRLRVDCHVHTEASYDSTAPVGSVLDAARRADLDGLVVTDHDRVDGALRARDRAAAREDDLLVVPGVEVSTADGHLLAIGVTDCPAPGRPFAESVATVRDRGGLAVVPHPFQRSRHGVAAGAVTDCDGVETLNAHAVTGVRNRQATAFAAARSSPCFGGSDAHRPDQVGRAHTVVTVPDGRPSVESVLAAMRAGQTRAAGGHVPLARYVGHIADTARLPERPAWNG